MFILVYTTHATMNLLREECLNLNKSQQSQQTWNVRLDGRILPLQPCLFYIAFFASYHRKGKEQYFSPTL